MSAHVPALCSIAILPRIAVDGRLTAALILMEATLYAVPYAVMIPMRVLKLFNE